jgi:hypothetical protein
MKIKIRDVGLLAVGFFIGAIVTVGVTTTPTRPLNPPASSVMASRVVLASASLPPQFVLTNIQWLAETVQVVLPPTFIERFDSQDPRRTYLIDTRYQPEDIKLDDLK